LSFEELYSPPPPMVSDLELYTSTLNFKEAKINIFKIRAAATTAAAPTAAKSTAAALTEAASASAALTGSTRR